MLALYSVLIPAPKAFAPLLPCAQYRGHYFAIALHTRQHQNSPALSSAVCLPHVPRDFSADERLRQTLYNGAAARGGRQAEATSDEEVRQARTDHARRSVRGEQQLRHVRGAAHPRHDRHLHHHGAHEKNPDAKALEPVRPRQLPTGAAVHAARRVRAIVLPLPSLLRPQRSGSAATKRGRKPSVRLQVAYQVTSLPIYLCAVDNAWVLVRSVCRGYDWWGWTGDEEYGNHPGSSKLHPRPRRPLLHASDVWVIILFFSGSEVFGTRTQESRRFCFFPSKHCPALNFVVG